MTRQPQTQRQNSKYVPFWERIYEVRAPAAQNASSRVLFKSTTRANLATLTNSDACHAILQRIESCAPAMQNADSTCLNLQKCSRRASF